MQYAVVIVDEYAALSLKQFERIWAAWTLCHQFPLLIFCGDFQQLSPWDDENGLLPSAAKSSLFRSLRVRTLHMLMRTMDLKLARILARLRFMSADATIMRVMRRRAIGEEMSYQAVAACLIQNPHTIFVAVSKAAVALINQWAVQYKFSGFALATVRCEYEDIDLHAGMRIMLTRNLNKSAGLCNGCFGEVTEFADNLIYITMNGEEHIVHRWTDKDVTGTFFPIVIGYATTLAKTQGFTVPHVTGVPDINGVPGVGYTLLSRVRTIADFNFVCPPETAFFKPASLV